MTPIARREMAAWRFSRKEMRLFLAIGYCACYCFGPVVEGLAPVLRRDSPAELRAGDHPHRWIVKFQDDQSKDFIADLCDSESQVSRGLPTMTCTQNSVRSNLLGIQLDNDADLDVLRRALPDAIKFIEPDHKVRTSQLRSRAPSSSPTSSPSSSPTSSPSLVTTPPTTSPTSPTA
eukprot:CAMPEP_0114231848 /NCGR_PEP_ID=MMETSP0058-20121206/4279_1 /TAXON_ID=36894 /ORGANISM="Pyramimonas parkeae, CCMP726" /LENGTH=175 /DNA_ID=CAMNT_0001343257 /DNA_START=134 /DNA_END=658 /DNA_ORIENTATION=-